MSDKFGALALPALPLAATGDDITDRPTTVLADYFKAVLNANAQVAFDSVVPRRGGVSVPVVRKSLAYDPRRFAFNEADLPALYLWRLASKPSWLAEDVHQDVGQIQLFWVYQPVGQERQIARDPFINGIAKSLVYAIEMSRDPAYVVTGDMDVQAASIAALPTSIKTSVATSTSQQVYSGVALDGSIGQSTMAPARAITITGSGTAGSFTADSAITIVGEDVVGISTTWTLNVPHVVLTPFTATIPNDCRRVTSVTFAAQTGTAGAWTIGTSAFSGLGSLFLPQAGLAGCALSSWKEDVLVIEMMNAPKRSYWAMSAVLEIQELLTYDLAVRPVNSGVVNTITRSDGSVYEAGLST